MDGQLHGDACAERSGRVPGRGSDPASRSDDRCRTAQHEGTDGSSRCVAAVARVCRDASVAWRLGYRTPPTRPTQPQTGGRRMTNDPELLHNGPIYYDDMSSPIGRLRLVADSD